MSPRPSSVPTSAAKSPLGTELNSGTASDAGAVLDACGETLLDTAVPKALSTPN